MVSLTDHNPVTVILRVKCTFCGHSNALLYEMLIPYSSYRLHLVLTVAEA